MSAGKIRLRLEGIVFGRRQRRPRAEKCGQALGVRLGRLLYGGRQLLERLDSYLRSPEPAVDQVPS